MPAKSLDEQFWARVNKTESCWLWTGAVDGRGYGAMKRAGKLHKVHRFAYELIVGEIPDFLTIDHLCKNKLCCNPSHLEPVTAGENSRRAEPGKHNKLKTHCSKGHEFTPQNTHIYKKQRFCRACNLDYTHKRRANAGGNPCPKKVSAQ